MDCKKFAFPHQVDGVQRSTCWVNKHQILGLTEEIVLEHLHRAYQTEKRLGRTVDVPHK